MNEFVLFQSFIDEAEAMPILEVLKDNRIEYTVEKFKEPLDSVIAGEVIRDKFYLKIKSQDFPKANEVLDQVILKNISNIESDYYLFSFSNEELLEIIKKPDEWSRQDFLIARNILNDRGEKINDDEIKTLKSKRIQELGQQEKEPGSQIVAGYIFAFLFSLGGLFFGLALLVTKKTLPDGSKIFAYSQSTRNHGRNIFIISLIMMILFIIERGNILSLFDRVFNS